jgi:hypothetical protein
MYCFEVERHYVAFSVSQTFFQMSEKLDRSLFTSFLLELHNKAEALTP